MTAGKIIAAIITIFSVPALIFILAGDWFWIEGWIFSIWFIVLCVTSILYLYFKDPALLLERYNMPGKSNQKSWDEYVVYGISFGFLALFVITPLDAKRFGWTTYFPFWLKIAGCVFLIISFFFMYRSYTDNTYLSPLVRIQTERKQKVVTTGVYGFVRHPMYLGATMLFLGAPMLMGSMFGILIGVALILLLSGRIIGEEKMLLSELEGYEDYRKKVKYRLIPFIW
jgi:protein-S-isoprenylcysteine O-methyltransferase Ste14